MTIERFAASRRSRWERLSDLVGRLGRPRGLSVGELDELARLYRQTSGDLAVAQRDFPQDATTGLLNGLVGRAHRQIYRQPPAPWRHVRRFFTHEFPQEYRAGWPFLAASAALLFGPLFTMIVAIVLAPETAALVLPPGLLREIEGGHTWFASELPKRPTMASFIMTHNIQIAVLAFAGGMLGGLGTVLVLIYNGIMLGAVAGALIAYGLAEAMGGFVSPHGFLELSAIVVSGACGLMLGHAMVWPGLQTRGAALQTAARRSMRLLLGSQTFLVVAGLLEGFVSPS